MSIQINPTDFVVYSKDRATNRPVQHIFSSRETFKDWLHAQHPAPMTYASYPRQAHGPLTYADHRAEYYPPRLTNSTQLQPTARELSADDERADNLILFHSNWA